jgi:hypothetical protein
MGNSVSQRPTQPPQQNREKQRNAFITCFFDIVKCNEIQDISLISKAFHLLLFVTPHHESIYYNNNHSLHRPFNGLYHHDVSLITFNSYVNQYTDFYRLMALFFNIMKIADEQRVCLDVYCFELNKIMCEKANILIAENESNINLLQNKILSEHSIEEYEKQIIEINVEIATAKCEMTNTNITKREIITINDKLTTLYSKLNELNVSKSLYATNGDEIRKYTGIIRELQIYNDKLRKFISICICEDYRDTEKGTVESVKPSKEIVICPADVDCVDVK